MRVELIPHRGAGQRSGREHRGQNVLKRDRVDPRGAVLHHPGTGRREGGDRRSDGGGIVGGFAKSDGCEQVRIVT